MPTSDWYCRIGDAVSGPFSWNEVLYLSSRGKLTARDSVRQGSSGDWVSTRTFSGLLQAAPVKATSPRNLAAPSQKSSLPRPANASGLRGKPAPITPEREAVQPVQQGESAGGISPADRRPSFSPPAIPRSVPPEAEGRRKRRLIAATSLAALCLLLAVSLLFWLLRSQGGGRGTGESSMAGQGAIGEGEASGPSSEGGPEGDETSTPEGTADADANSPAASDSSSSQASSPPPPKPAIADASDSPSAGGSSKAPSRFSVGGSEFFGLTADGNRFVYIVDCSGSMNGDRFDAARRELLRSIESLEDGKMVFVLFFSDSHHPMYWPMTAPAQFVPAIPANKDRITKWVNGFATQGGTSPDTALDFALRMNPDAVYFLTDGGFADTALGVIQNASSGRIPIFTVGFKDRGGERLLQQIASATGGKYKFVP